MKEVLEHEFWVWWGIMISAQLFGWKGNMWDREVSEGVREKVNFDKHMLEYRFKDIKKYMPYLWTNNQRKNSDPWWQFSKCVEEFNKNRKKNVVANLLKVLDEAMLAYRPQTTKNNNLPHVTHLKQKPKDLGTEFKVVADSITWIFIFLEIQRGKELMRNPNFTEFTNVLRFTSACTKIMAKRTRKEVETNNHTNNNNSNNDNNSSNLPKETWIGNSWFSSVPSAVAVFEYGHYIGVLKTSHAHYPKSFIKTKMK